MHFFDKRLEEKIQGTPAYYEKRKREQKQHEIVLLNQQLQRLVVYTPYAFVKEHEVLVQTLHKANRTCLQSSILQLRYRDNFESIGVAVATMEFLLAALPKLSEDKQKKIKPLLRINLRDLRRLAPNETRHLTLLL